MGKHPIALLGIAYYARLIFLGLLRTCPANLVLTKVNSAFHKKVEYSKHRPYRLRSFVQPSPPHGCTKHENHHADRTSAQLLHRKHYLMIGVLYLSLSTKPPRLDTRQQAIT